jgi:hypothetical protein
MQNIAQCNTMVNHMLCVAHTTHSTHSTQRRMVSDTAHSIKHGPLRHLPCSAPSMHDPALPFWNAWLGKPENFMFRQHIHTLTYLDQLIQSSLVRPPPFSEKLRLNTTTACLSWIL